MMQQTMNSRAFALGYRNHDAIRNFFHRIARFFNAALEAQQDLPYGLPADLAARMYL